MFYLFRPDPFTLPIIFLIMLFGKWRAKAKRKAQLRAAALHVKEVVDYGALTEKRRGKAWKMFDDMGGYIYLGKCSYRNVLTDDVTSFGGKECVCRIEGDVVRMYTLEKPFRFFCGKEKPTLTDVVFPIVSFRRIRGEYYKDGSECIVRIGFYGDNPDEDGAWLYARTDRNPKMVATNVVVLLYEGLHGRRTDY